MRRILILGSLILVFSLLMTQPAMACSGGPPPWNDWLPLILENSDIVVTGSYVRVDDLGVNGIFHVDQYVVGGGPEFLLIESINHRLIENALFVHRYVSSCGGPNIRNVLSEEARYTYFLSRDRNGIYKIHHSRSFPNPQSTTSVWDRDRGEVKLTASAFHAQIATVAGTRLSKPDPDTREPRTTPILLTTERGQHYLLPVDTTELVPISDDEAMAVRRDQTQCGPPPCTVYSPNQLDIVYLRSSGESSNLNLGISTVVEVVGERIVFSATSDTYALWHDGQIHIHALWYPALGYPAHWMSSMYEPSESLNATPSGSSTDYPVAWSPDGRTLAFSTEQGLWLWDALTTDSIPELLLPVGDHVPVVRYFSPMGRYVAITDGSRHFTLDLVTRNELPDGVVSPNDRVLLAHDMVSDEPSSLDVIYLAPGPRQSAYYPEVEYRHVQWIDNENFVASISGFSYIEWLPAEPYQDSSGEWVYEALPHLVEEPFVEVSTYHSSSIYSEHRVPMSLSEIQMRDFTYTPGPGLIEISAEGYHLNMRGPVIDLTSQLPDPIATAVWLPYGFYFETD